MQICADIFSTLLERDGWGKRKGEESESKVDFVYLDICFCVYIHAHTNYLGTLWPITDVFMMLKNW